jgi:hypothetical protein
MISYSYLVHWVPLVSKVLSVPCLTTQLWLEFWRTRIKNDPVWGSLITLQIVPKYHKNFTHIRILELFNFYLTRKSHSWSSSFTSETHLELIFVFWRRIIRFRMSPVLPCHVNPALIPLCSKVLQDVIKHLLSS